MKNRLLNGIMKSFFTFGGSKSNNILNEKETVDYLLRTKKSLIRFGDGELLIMRGSSIHYQKYEKQLGTNLQYIMKKYNNDSNYLLALPKQALDHNIIKYIFHGQFKKTYLIFFTFRYVYKKYLDNNLNVYGDSFVFRKKNEYYYSLLWKGKKNVVFVHNSSKYFDIFKNMYGFNKNCYFVEIPSHNCYSRIEDIEKKMADILEKLDLANTVVLISAGPTAKELIIRINNHYLVQCIDTGHCWDTPLTNRMEDA